MKRPNYLKGASGKFANPASPSDIVEAEYVVKNAAVLFTKSDRQRPRCQLRGRYVTETDLWGSATVPSIGLLRLRFIFWGRKSMDD